MGEVRTLQQIWKRLGHGSPKVALEPACGTGRYLAVLRSFGWRVLGFDADRRMIRYARQAVRSIARQDRPPGALWVARFDAFASRVRLGSVGLAFCPINSIRHVAGDGEMVRHLRAVGRCLHPGGVYAVGISLSAYGLEAPSEDVWVGRRDGVRVKQVISFTPAPGGSVRRRGEKVVSVLEVRQERKTETRSSAYSLLSYSRREWESVVGRSGLRIIGVVNEGCSPYDPGEIGYAIWVLARPDHPLVAGGKAVVRG